MRHLSLVECNYVAGGDGQFKVIVTNKQVPANCANFVAGVYEQVLKGQLTAEQAAYQLVFSAYPMNQIDAALDSLDIKYW